MNFSLQRLVCSAGFPACGFRGLCSPDAFWILQLEKRRAAVGESRRFLQSQRDCGAQPRVGRNDLPWVTAGKVFNPNGVVPRSHRAATPLGLWACDLLSQGSSFLATLGFKPESRWDSSLKFPNGISPGPQFLRHTQNTELESSVNRQTGMSPLPAKSQSSLQI
jgi:hypothetical protein